MIDKRAILPILALCLLTGLVPDALAQPAVMPADNPPYEWGSGIKVLIISGGGWHEFDRWFGQADTATLKAAGITSVHYTKNATNAAAELPNADVVLLSANAIGFDTPAYRKALFDHIAAGKGVVVLHSGAWHNWVWPEYDLDVVGGNYSSHDGEGPFQEHVLMQHPVTTGLPETFRVVDETYHTVADPAGPGVDVLVQAERGGAKYASVWVVHNPKARIVCIALGHDGNTHNSPNFQKLLVNAVTWTAGH